MDYQRFSAYHFDDSLATMSIILQNIHKDTLAVYSKFNPSDDFSVQSNSIKAYNNLDSLIIYEILNALNNEPLEKVILENPKDDINKLGQSIRSNPDGYNFQIAENPSQENGLLRIIMLSILSIFILIVLIVPRFRRLTLALIKKPFNVLVNLFKGKSQNQENPHLNEEIDRDNLDKSCAENEKIHSVSETDTSGIDLWKNQHWQVKGDNLELKSGENRIHIALEELQRMIEEVNEKRSRKISFTKSSEKIIEKLQNEKSTLEEQIERYKIQESKSNEMQNDYNDLKKVKEELEKQKNEADYKIKEQIKSLDNWEEKHTNEINKRVDDHKIEVDSLNVNLSELKIKHSRELNSLKERLEKEHNLDKEIIATAFRFMYTKYIKNLGSLQFESRIEKEKIGELMLGLIYHSIGFIKVYGENVLSLKEVANTPLRDQYNTYISLNKNKQYAEKLNIDTQIELKEILPAGDKTTFRRIVEEVFDLNLANFDKENDVYLDI